MDRTSKTGRRCRTSRESDLKVVSEIHDPVTTTDELIPSGETSSYRSNPLGLAEFTLSRKDPAYVGRAKEVQKAENAIENGNVRWKHCRSSNRYGSASIKKYPDVRRKTWRWKYDFRSKTR